MRDRDRAIEQLQRQKRQQAKVPEPPSAAPQTPAIAVPEHPSNQTELEGSQPSVAEYNEASIAGEIEPVNPKQPVPYVRVYESYDEIEREWRSS